MSSRAQPSLRAYASALGWFVIVRLLVLATLVAVAAKEGRSASRVLVKWDAQWYQEIAANGYGYTRLDHGRVLSDYAFFPLFPALERAVGALTGLGFADAGLAVSAVFSVVAAAGVYAVVEEVWDPQVAWIATILWAVLPMGIVESMSYSESLFTALAAWALYAVMTEQWLPAGVLAALAGITRPAGVAVAASVVFAAVASPTARRRLGAPLAAAVLAPLGVVAYLVWVGLRTGSPTGYLRVASSWGNGLDGGAAFATWTWHRLTGPRPLEGVGVLLGLALVGTLLCLAVRRQPLPLLVFSGVLVFLAITTSGYYGSKPRYLLPAFPLLVPVAQWLAGRRPWLLTTVLAGMTVVAAGYGALWLLGPGPP